MIRTVLGLLLSLVLSLYAFPTHAADPAGKDPASDALLIFQKRFPELKVLATTPSPIPGLFEIVLHDRVVYYAPATGHLLVGDLWDSAGKNLSREHQARLMSEKIKDLPLDLAVRIGNGKHIVIEVTDPDCPYCRKGDSFLAQRTDLTRYIFFYPLPMHPNAPQKAAFVLAATDPAKAYAEIISGKYDQQPLPPFTDNGRLAQHRAIADKLGVRGTPKYWINGNYLSGANIEAMEQLLR